MILIVITHLLYYIVLVYTVYIINFSFCLIIISVITVVFIFIISALIVHYFLTLLSDIFQSICAYRILLDLSVRCYINIHNRKSARKLPTLYTIYKLFDHLKLQ